MYDSLVFYNSFGAGDLFESREFIKEIMSTVEASEYFYCHSKNSRMFSDIPNLKYNSIDGRMSASVPFSVIDNRLFINTWIGHNSKYVLSQVGCVIDKNYEMFNDTLRKLSLPLLSKPFIEYLPTVDFSYFNTKSIDKFFSRNKYKKSVLVCNGTVNSNQADNFDMSIPIKVVAAENKDTLFLTTQEITTSIENIVPCHTITNSEDGFDLNEISYLAGYVDVIVGRKSGPFVFAHTKDVWYSNKKSLSFTYAKHSSHFVQSDDLPLKKYWSPCTKAQEVIEEIGKVINE